MPCQSWESANSWPIRDMWLTAGETRGVSKPNKWNEFSDIRKIHRTCRTKGFLAKLILRPTPLLAALTPKTLNLPSRNRRAQVPRTL